MMDLRREIMRIQARLSLNLMGASDIVRWAEEKINRGGQYEVLADLSSISPADDDQVFSGFVALTGQLGLVSMTQERAGIIMAGQVAQELNEGNITPAQAAGDIWRIARLAPAAEPQLRQFIGLASEWEDDPESRELYEEEIRAEAGKLADAVTALLAGADHIATE
jgi:hypothetical protein